MCGITGIIDLKGRRQIDRDQVARMAAMLTHRGPDDSGFHFAPGVGLGHRRLSIVGLEDGRQPLFSEDGEIAVICNGELFDFRERRAELEAKGHVFRTHTDSEIIVHLYEEYGEDFFQFLKGQFAFALVDFRKRVVLMARDRVGICPLFWTRQGDTVYFGSEIKALLASGEVPAEADVRGLDHMFTFFALTSPRTAFAGVQSVPPGKYLRIALDGSGRAAEPQIRRYWDFDFPDWGDEYDPGETAAVDGFEAAFERAVDLRLRADVPVVGYLSGGVDSAYVMAMAAKVLGRPLPSFTVQVPGTELDESDKAAEAVAAIGGKQTIVETGANVLSENYAGLVTGAEAPVLDTSCAALVALSHGVREQGYKTVVAGEGSDEGLAGYVWFKIREAGRRLDIGDGFRPSVLLGRIARKIQSPDHSFSEFAHIDSMIGGPHAQSLLYNLVSTARDRYYSGDMWDRLDGHVAYEDIDLDLERMKRWHPLNRSLYFGYKVHLPGLLLSQKGDRVAMANSVEVRYPFLDEDVIAYISKLHPKWKLHGLRGDKYVLRKAAERILPQQIAHRPKNMFRAPLAETFLADPPVFVRDLLSPESLRRTGYFNAARVLRDQELLAKGDEKLATFASLGLGGVVATQLWHHLYLGGGLCELPEVDMNPVACKHSEGRLAEAVAAAE
ncbi:Asparagine synthetase [glutamine-hydrolyzing] 3 [Methyloligella halotolerans]|uniref:asparagine synthase (glutamine-hydrolyzing) n=1 Tax=Methyloligella halotolerans TaxID=1177755 RepID=A0A1E2S0T2_9HYPH|nr:asparagine synthase (glutamine-hydrolyzing) [Methyloligella halotolerans]ODA68071.1 Asparagine synthetase [glutamine-hydrolyzing] 3 [Methyloligella halotolerans]